MSIVRASRLGIVISLTSTVFVACSEDTSTTTTGTGASGNAGGGPASSSSSSSSSTSTASGGGEGGTAGAGNTGGTAGGGGTGGTPVVCGDGVIGAGEDCDGADLAGKSCTDFGYTTAAGLACDATACTFDQTGCAATCDGAAAEPGEYCDGTDLDGHDCTELMYVEPAGLVCNATCDGVDSSGCTAACNGTLEPTEECDGGVFAGGFDCTSFGFDNPVGLSCTNCFNDSTTCTGTCDGMNVEPDEECDGANLDGASCNTFGYVDPAGLTCSNCSLDTSGCTAVCGNLVQEPGEECDGVPSSPDQTCTIQCKVQFITLHINEILYDPPGGDAGCYIEIVGPPGTSLTGYSLKFTKGSDGTEYVPPLLLTNQTIGSSGYFVVAQDATVVVGAGANSMISIKANMQNGPDNVQLLLGAVVVDAVGYGTFGAGTFFMGEGTPWPGVNNSVQSVSRLPNGADTSNNFADFALGTQTPGLPNLP